MAGFPQGFKVALLVSEDEVRQAATTILSACSYQALPAASLDDCLQLCSVQRIDIVLAESKDLTADPEKTMMLMGSLKNVPLIVMSDSDTPSAVFHGLKIGAVDFLKRPLDEAKVRSMWQHTLQKRMTAAPLLGEEGGMHLQRRLPTTTPPEQQGSTGIAKMSGSTLSEGSSNEPKAPVQMKNEPTAAPPQPDPTAESGQNFPTEQQTTQTTPPSAPRDTTSATHATSPSHSFQGTEARKRPHRAENPKRRIRPNLSTRDTLSSTSSSHVPGPATTAAMAMPPLLGIPPGCVPPVGSNGQAIGMPFLNQHPFVPPNPMSIQSFGFMPPFMYSHPPDQDLMTGLGTASDSSVLSPFPPTRPSTSVQTPPMTVSQPPVTEAIRDLPRVSSTPISRTQDDISAPAVTPQTELPDVPHRPLQKSPSLINF